MSTPGGLVVTVFGRPVTQGSKTRTRWGMRDDNGERLRPWRAAVTDAAVRALDAVGAADPMGGVHSVDTLSPGSGKKGSELVRTPDHVRDAAEMVTVTGSEGGASGAHPWERLDGPVLVDVTFWFDRPKSAPKLRRCWPITRSSGDLDKLCRAVFDALVDAGVMRDDSQVVTLTARKAHVGDVGALHVPGARIEVWAVSGG